MDNCSREYLILDYLLQSYLIALGFPLTGLPLPDYPLSGFPLMVYPMTVYPMTEKPAVDFQRPCTRFWRSGKQPCFITPSRWPADIAAWTAWAGSRGIPRTHKFDASGRADETGRNGTRDKCHRNRCRSGHMVFPSLTSRMPRCILLGTYTSYLHFWAKK